MFDPLGPIGNTWMADEKSTWRVSSLAEASFKKTHQPRLMLTNFPQRNHLEGEILFLLVLICL